MNRSKEEKKIPLMLTGLKLQNVRGFKEADLSFEREGKPRHQTLIIGHNGHGKSTLLRAIAIGMSDENSAKALMGSLAGPMLRQNKQGILQKEAFITVRLADPSDPKTTFSIQTRIFQGKGGKETLEQTTNPEDFPWDRLFLCGYGVNRVNSSYAPVKEYNRYHSVRSLFEEGAFLYDPEATLLSFKTLSEKQWYPFTIGRLKALLTLPPSYEIHAENRPVTVNGPWGRLPLHALGDGYRGTATWVLDFLARAQLAMLSFQNRKLHGGVILVDEIDEHLHPSWQRIIFNLLGKKFPNFQFIGTTHSPMTIVECKPDEVVACQLFNAVAYVQTDLPSLYGKTTDQILKGAWFGLSETMTEATEKLLKKYRDAVQAKQNSSDLARLREQIQDDIGPMIVTPIDELAQELAHEYRKQLSQRLSFEERKKLLGKLVQKMNDRQAETE